MGVDVFFVLSGYLVTSVLLRDLQSGGRVRLARFYARRVRRLLPAAVLTLTATLVLYAAVADAGPLDSARRAAQAAFVYLANWFFVREAADYFATDRDANPILHFWSLAVEEQFYLVWPVVLSGLVLLARRLPGSTSRWLQAAVAAGIAVSVGLALAWRTSAPDRAYFGTDTRAYQLLAGALLALAPGIILRLRRQRMAAEGLAVVALVALLAVASSAWSVGPIVRGVATALVALVLIAGTEAASGGPVARLVSLKPLVHLGRISYGTYLWHWPALVILREVRPMSDRSLFVVAAVLATALAALSFELVEQPVRTWRRLDRRPVPVALSGLLVGGLAAFLLVPGLPGAGGSVQPGSGPASTLDTALARHLTPVPPTFSSAEVWMANSPDFVTCVGQPAADCTVHRGNGPHILLMGDSTMHAVVSGFEELARRQDLTLSLGTRPGCPWPRGHYVLNADIQSACKELKEDLYTRVLPALRPDVVVLLDSGISADLDQADPADSPGAPAYRTAVLASVPQLAEFAGSVVMIDPLPKAAPLLDPLECLSRALYVEQCRFVAPAGRSWMEELYREAAAIEPRASVLDLDRLACPTLPICEAMVDGRAVWWDGQHIARDFAATWADDLHRELAAIGVLPPRR